MAQTYSGQQLRALTPALTVLALLVSFVAIPPVGKKPFHTGLPLPCSLLCLFPNLPWHSTNLNSSPSHPGDTSHVPWSQLSGVCCSPGSVVSPPSSNCPSALLITPHFIDMGTGVQKGDSLSSWWSCQHLNSGLTQQGVKCQLPEDRCMTLSLAWKKGPWRGCDMSYLKRGSSWTRVGPKPNDKHPEKDKGTWETWCGARTGIRY